jgi:peptidoglycan/LPS O-acetylase OafA/YrhL
MYISPTFICIFTCFYFFAFKHHDKTEPLSLGAVKRNPLRIVDFYSLISFQYYLWHSNILTAVVTIFKNYTNKKIYICVLLMGGLLTTIMATVFYLIVDRPLGLMTKGENTV